MWSITLLWQEVIKNFEDKLNLPKEVLTPYLNQVTENIIFDSNNALTGPLVRKDYQTIEANLHALRKTNLVNIYRSFIELFSKRQIR